jgi:flagellar hook-basal body complex protein FliE
MPMRPVDLDAVKPLVAPASAARADAVAPARDFGDALKAALDGVNDTQRRADTLARAFQGGAEDASLEDTMVAIATANVSFQSLVQVRNRVVAAYNDIMNMPV